MAKLFFLISCEHESLSFCELKAILEAEGYEYSLTEKLDQTVRLEADQNSVWQVQRRSGYTRVCGLELFACRATDEDFKQSANAPNSRFVLALATRYSGLLQV